MRRIVLTLTTLLLGYTLCSATMTNSRLRRETRFLTDKMAYELNLTRAQYNDVYEINYDFIDNVRFLMNDVLMGYEWALDDYYRYLDLRNDDLRWVLSSYQYHTFMGADYFFRPIYVSGGNWAFRIYVTYSNRNHFFFPKPSHYRSYVGGHGRPLHQPHAPSYYQGRHDQPHYSVKPTLREEKNYRTARRSDFGSVNVQPNTSKRPAQNGTVVRTTTTRKSAGTSSTSARTNSSSRRTGTSSQRANESSQRTGTQRSATTSSRSDKNSGTSRNEQGTVRTSSTKSSTSGTSARQSEKRNEVKNSTNSTSRRSTSTSGSSSTSSRSSSSRSTKSSRR